MAAAFSYRPKFVDIRVKRPGAATPERAAGERPCDHVGCKGAGGHKAPKSRTGGNDFWFFCAEHAGEYNRRWDYFRDMTQAEMDAHNRGEEIGHRPTWTFRPGKGDRVSATRFWQSARPGDTFNMFGDGAEPARKSRAPRVGRVQALALDVLALEEGANAEAIRTRYAMLVKRYHPDSNGGDRSAEAQLHKVIRAYQTLKAAGMT